MIQLKKRFPLRIGSLLLLLALTFTACKDPNSGVTDPCLTAHDWSEWTVTTAPTCTEKGEETRTCKHNSTHTETRDVDPLGHDWETIEGTEPTCTEKGSGTRKCKVCGETETGEIPIDPTAHDWSDWTVTTAPTCTDKGEETRTCNHNPEHTETRDIDPLGHNWEVIGDGKAPTCTEEGHGTLQCKTCDETVTGDTIPIDPTAHDWGEWAETTAPTCTDKGEETRICKHNNTHTEKRDVDPLGHDFGEWADKTSATCTEAGTQERVCKHNPTHTETRNNPEAPIDPTAHDWGDWTKKTTATCTEAGTQERTCNHNPAHIDIRNNPDAPALGHDMQWVVTQTATATIDGLETLTCSRCGHTDGTRILYATGTAGLAYELINGDTAYSVSRGTVTSGNVFIPAYIYDDISGQYLPVKEAADEAFNQTGITGVTFAPNSELETISYRAFRITALTSVTIPASVKTIGNSAFRSSANLESVTFAEGSVLESIGQSAFENTAIKNITIPASVKTIGTNAFTDCASLKSVIFEDGSLLETIDNNTFQNSGITSIIIPASVKTVNNAAFYDCADLDSVYFGGDAAAWGGITIGNNNTPLTNATRYYYNATTPTTAGRFWRWVDGEPAAWCTHDNMRWIVTTPATATTDGLETYTCMNDCVHTDGTRIAYATGTAGLIYSFRSGTNNTEYRLDRSTVTSGTVHIPAYHRPNVNSPYLPVTIVGSGAFMNQTGITGLTFAHNSRIDNIDIRAFNNTGITSVIIPASVKTIGEYAFECDTLESVTFEAGSALETIGEGAFQNTKIASIIIPASVKTINERAFRNCASLKSVIFEQGSVLETIVRDVFLNTDLVSVVIPASVKTISNYVFNNSTSLTTVFYEGTNLAAWGAMAISIGNNPLISAPRYYYSATAPTTTGNFWRYVDGVPTAW